MFRMNGSFRRLMNKFEEEYFTSMPEYACAYCGVLSPLRKTVWVDLDRTVDYGLESRLGLPLCRNEDGKIAICGICRRRKRKAPDVGPWPRAILEVPQRSRMYLSFVRLNCNLGRTQSHSGTDWHNPYSTYRTLSGKNLPTYLCICAAAK